MSLSQSSSMPCRCAASVRFTAVCTCPFQPHAVALARGERGFRRGDWRVRTLTRTRLTSTPDTFVIHAELDAHEGDRRVFAGNRGIEVARDLV